VYIHLPDSGHCGALSIGLGLIVAAIWLTMFGIYRYSSMAAITALGSSPILGLFFATPRYFLPLVIIAGLVLWQHRDNINRLMEGTEPKMAPDSAKKQSDKPPQEPPEEPPPSE